MKVVAFVPIKLNSQRLQGKNILPVAGKPMCYHICRTLLDVSGVDGIYTYCSDEKIMEACKAVGLHHFIFRMVSHFCGGMSVSTGIWSGEKRFMNVLSGK